MSQTLTTLYSILGISRTASTEEIRRAYHHAARHYHPDVNTRPGETELFLQAQQAYEILSDPQKRAAYDATLPAMEPSDSPVRVRTTYSRTFLPVLDAPQLVYALLEFTPSSPDSRASASRTALNLALVLDHSTSMQGARIQAVKAAALELIGQLSPQDILSVIVFNDRAETLLSGAVQAESKDIAARINHIEAGGGTEIYRGLAAGYAELRRHLSPERVNHLILLTDGRTYGDEAACLELAEQAARTGVGISGIGFGSEWNDIFLDELCARTGCSADFILHPSSLKGYLAKKFKDLSLDNAGRVELTLGPLPDVELTAVQRICPDPGPLPVNSPLTLGRVPRAGKLSVLFEFKLQPLHGMTGQVHLLSASASIQPPSGQAASLWIELERPLGESDQPEHPPQEILQAVSQLTMHRLQEQARRSVAEGDISAGTRHLQALATHLLAGGAQSLADDVFRETVHLQKYRDYSQTGAKQIKYGTRALILPSIPSLDQDAVPLPECQHQEPAGALFCSSCGIRLDQVRQQPSSENTAAAAEQSGHALDSPDLFIALKMIEADVVLPVAGQSEITLGRISEGQPFIPDIDLGPYRAFEAGVSRLHAALQIEDQKLYIVDLGSANGTRINDKKIKPHQPHPLHNGDVCTFGRLKVQILFQLSTQNEAQQCPSH